MQILFFDGEVSRTPFLLMIENGAAFDPVNKWGVTHLMARMMLANTERLPGERIRSELEMRDAEIHVKVEWDGIYFYGTSPIDQLEPVLGLLSETVVRPLFDEETFQVVQSQIIEELEELSQNLEGKTQSLLRADLFGNNPYARPVKGTPESLRNIELADVKLQYRRLIMPNQARLAFYYSEDREALFRQLSPRWGGWVRDNAAPFTFRQAPEKSSPSSILLKTPTEEGIFRWGQLAVEMASPDYHALKVLEQYILLSIPEWAEQISSRSQIRAVARLHAGKMPGYLEISLQAPQDQLLAYYNMFSGLMDDLRQGKLITKRFEEAKQLVLHEFSSSLQDPMLKLQRVLEADLYNLGINYIPTFSLRLDRVTPERFKKLVADRFPPHQFVLVVAADDRVEPYLSQLGEFEILQ